MSGPFLGQIMIFAGNFAPAGCAICDGSLLAVADNPQLFELIGTRYGGDGQSSFALPDLRGRVPIGQGQGRGLSPYSIGQSVGVEQVGLTTAQLSPHSHRLNAVAGPGTSNVPADNTLLSSLGGQAASGEFETPAFAPSGNQTPLAVRTIGQTGGGEPHSNIQPYLAINFCIALSGSVPG
jgi:microcystin-dependent protein